MPLEIVSALIVPGSLLTTTMCADGLYFAIILAISPYIVNTTMMLALRSMLIYTALVAMLSVSEISLRIPDFINRIVDMILFGLPEHFRTPEEVICVVVTHLSFSDYLRHDLNTLHREQPD